MKLTVLLENTSSREDLVCAHGLSLYIEAGGHPFLFDAGPDDSFLRNAETLGIDPGKAEYAVLSHGHYDHGGGLPAYAERYPDRPVYLRENAFGYHTNASGRYNGLEPSLQAAPGLVRTGTEYRLGADRLLFSDVAERELLSPINGNLFCDGKPDRFLHEQSLLMEENGKLILIGGCAHCGIVNIMEKARRLAGRLPDIVFSGLHLSVHGQTSDDAFLDLLARRLSACPTEFVTFHCTGTDAYRRLKERMGDQISYLSTGQSVEIG